LYDEENETLYDMIVLETVYRNIDIMISS